MNKRHASFHDAVNISADRETSTLPLRTGQASLTNDVCHIRPTAEMLNATSDPTRPVVLQIC